MYSHLTCSWWFSLIFSYHHHKCPSFHLIKKISTSFEMNISHRTFFPGCLTLRILTPQKWLFWGPGPLLCRFKPFHWRVQGFLGHKTNCGTTWCYVNIFLCGFHSGVEGDHLRQMFVSKWENGPPYHCPSYIWKHPIGSMEKWPIYLHENHKNQPFM